MAIVKVEMFAIKCDNCTEEFHDEHTGYSGMSTAEDIHGLADNAGWHTSDDDKHYCPTCFEIDEDDNLKIILWP